MKTKGKEVAKIMFLKFRLNFIRMLFPDKIQIRTSFCSNFGF